MPQLIIRDVPPDVARALRQRAARNGRSAEAEHRILLRDALQAELEARSFKAVLTSMPDVGTDADFAPPRDLPRELA